MKEVSTRIPGICDCITLYNKNDFVSVIWFRILRDLTLYKVDRQWTHQSLSKRWLRFREGCVIDYTNSGHNVV